VKIKQWHVRFADYCYRTLRRQDTGMTAKGLIQSYVESKGTRYVPNITNAAWILRRDGRFNWSETKRAVYTAKRQ
jgi:hypothetical protein